MKMRIRINEIDDYHNNDKNSKGNKDNIKSNDNDQKQTKNMLNICLNSLMLPGGYT